MIQRFAKTPAAIIILGSLPFAWPFLFSLTVMAEPGSSSCQNRYRQIVESQQTLRLFEQQQQQLQKRVRVIYQELFACQSGSGQSTAQHQHCTQIKDEGPRYFQSLIKTTALKHQKSQQLVHQTRLAQLTCSNLAINTTPHSIILDRP